MLKNRSWLICMLLIAVLLVACADDDDADTDDAATSAPAAIETTAASGAADAEGTPTEDAAEPTEEEAEMAGTSEPTEDTADPTEDADTTATEDTGSATGTPDDDDVEFDSGATPDADETPASQAADPELEAALFEIILTEEDLPSGWTEVNTMASDSAQTDIGICNIGPFSDLDDRLAGVESEFEQDPVQGPFLIQSLAAYPEDLAIEAFEYARDTLTDCTEWTDSAGITYTLEPQDDYPEFGDDSFVSRITFEVSGVGPVPGEFFFIRVGGLLTFMGYIVVGEVDTDAVTDIAETATEKMEDADLDL